MFLSNHAAVGAMLAVHTTNPVSAFVIGYFSHYLLDLIPHGDEKVGTWVKKKNTMKRGVAVAGFDVIIMIIFFASLSWKIDFPHPYTVAFGVFGSILPDLMFGTYDILIKHLSESKKKFIQEKGGRVYQFGKKMVWDNFFLERHFYFHKKVHFALGYTISLTQGLIFQLSILAFMYWSVLNYLRI